MEMLSILNDLVHLARSVLSIYGDVLLVAWICGVLGANGPGPIAVLKLLWNGGRQ